MDRFVTLDDESVALTPCPFIATRAAQSAIAGAAPNPSLRGAQRRGNPCLLMTGPWIASFLAMTELGWHTFSRGMLKGLKCGN